MRFNFYTTQEKINCENCGEMCKSVRVETVNETESRFGMCPRCMEEFVRGLKESLFDYVITDVLEVNEEIANLKEEIVDLKHDISELEEEVDNLEGEKSDLQDELDNLK